MDLPLPNFENHFLSIEWFEIASALPFYNQSKSKIQMIKT